MAAYCNAFSRRPILNLVYKQWIYKYDQVRLNSGEVLFKLLRRGLVKDIFPNNNINAPGRSCAYAGFDPTADSLHVGNLLVLISLIHWQRCGFNSVVVIGDATAEIGDPSEHKDDRNILDRDIINTNSDTIETNVKNIFCNHEKYIWIKRGGKAKSLGSFSVFRNSEWYAQKNIVDFFSKIGRYIRVGEMLSRTSVKSRMESGKGINFSEFSYQAFQAFDWLWLFKKHNCRFQFGGSDQMGNITTGFNLIDGSQGQHVYGAVLPLVQSETGDKFGKSSGNAVYLSSHKTSPFDLYQFFMRVADTEIENYLKLFTFLSLKEIEDIMEKQMKNPHLRFAQQKLAGEVTLLLHGEDGLQSAQNSTRAIFQSDVESLSKLSIEELKQIVPQSTITQIILEPGLSLLDITMKAGCFLNEGDANRIISGGGVYVNFTKITLPSAVLIPEHHILPNGTTLIRVGKKTHYLVIWK